MLDRDWILSTLARLPVLYWPVFFLDLLWVQRYMRAQRAAHPEGGMVGIGVTHKGRIHIKWKVTADIRSDADWTVHAPRTPWFALDPDTLAAAFATFAGSACDPTGIDLVSAYDRPVFRPLNLAPG
ncbi:hypothetical protein WNY37_03750 [Henriciella sp. AS95]|uniref:hypothetical protein n=1 Tax=Henriciella sp. AS95 TaxID=3135782 RepID=UPI003174848E